VVATVRNWNEFVASPTGTNPVDLETQVRDLEFAMGVMHDLPDVDADRLSVMDTAWACRRLDPANAKHRVDAVVGLDATYAAPRLLETFTKSLYYNPNRCEFHCSICAGPAISWILVELTRSNILIGMFWNYRNVSYLFHH